MLCQIKQKAKMSKTNNLIFIVLHIVAWIIFVGLSIEACALLVNFIFSIYNPAFVDKLYQKMDLSAVYNRSTWVFYSMYGIAILISLMKAFLFYVVIRLLLKLDLIRPFSNYVSKQISLMAYFTFAIGLLSFIARQSVKGLMHRGYEINALNQFWVDSQAFIIMAAIIYVIATIFAKGVELQNENELTI